MPIIFSSQQTIQAVQTKINGCNQLRATLRLSTKPPFSLLPTPNTMLSSSSSFIRHGRSRFRFFLLISCRSLQHQSTSFPSLDLTHPTFMVYGSNTSVGKTLISAGLAASVLSSSSSSHPSTFLYLKPIQTGFPQDSDSRFVYRKVSDLLRHRLADRMLFASNQAFRASVPASGEILGFGSEGLGSYEEMRVGGVAESEVEGVRLVCKTLYGWNAAISPHLAVEKEGMEVDDVVLREMVVRSLEIGGRDGESGRKRGVWKVIETAGGVASPGPSGTLQCDLYRY